ncbi:YkgJ family cysteine cluster protein [Richelia intracellularis]|uniref:YkgJ family cysteine cluster protein n=1 Tax=Richelia intracellularis TaxID=1164990 RepID=UPI0005C58A3D|nr:YkgJ family cysteine cluster protein [Richelia intracellularis]
MATWQCVKFCGACCHLSLEERPDICDYLSLKELELYLSMIGEGGWCINFDHNTRECNIYSNRPRFCCVEPGIFQEMYSIKVEEFNDFAMECCHQQIEGVYGSQSMEMLHFDNNVRIRKAIYSS